MRTCIKFSPTGNLCKRFLPGAALVVAQPARDGRIVTFLRSIGLPDALADCSLTSLQIKLIKIGARVVHHARAISSQLAEVAVTGSMVRAILATIQRLRALLFCALPQSKSKLNKSGRTRLLDALKTVSYSPSLGQISWLFKRLPVPPDRFRLH